MDVEILELPQERPQANRRFDFQGLSDVLFESAELLEEALTSTDAEFRSAAIDLAVRSLYTASAAIDRYIKNDPAQTFKPAPAQVAEVSIVPGPWAAATQ
jgi:hypothetical protein